MYAVIESGGKQYRVEEGLKVKLEKLPQDEGDEVQITKVLAINDGSSMMMGNPYIEGAYVSAKVISQGRDRKVIVFKFKRRKDYKKKNGHRQFHTELLIEKIFPEAQHGA